MDNPVLYNCLGWMLNYFSPGSTMSREEALTYAGGLILSSALYSIIHHPYYLGVTHTGMRMRIAACSLIYRKVSIPCIYMYI